MYLTLPVLQLSKYWLILFLLLTWQIAYAQEGEQPVIINLKAIAGLQYDKVRFMVKPGSKVILSLENTDDMSHNLLITAPDKRLEVVNAALRLREAGPRQNYIPATSIVLWAIPVLAPGEKKTISFTAPKATGVYPYVCTYPGHGLIMFGAMYVTSGVMPAIQSDPHVPEVRKNDGTHDDDELHAQHRENKIKTLHPYTPAPPYLYRTFMPDAGPAAIAVHLPGGLSYCWDAGACRLRYAWQGGFIDNTRHWEAKGKEMAKVMGTIFYRDKTTYPLRIKTADKVPTVEFMGYQLQNRFPQFRYTINGMEVTELIQQQANGNGLVRIFKIPQAATTIWFLTDPEDGVIYKSSAGKWIKGNLKLSAKEARNFTITMTKKAGNTP
jgi:uncharacterized cupredoxin-like copper-binding protein